MFYIPARHKPKFGQAGIIPGHPLTPDFFLVLNEGGGNIVYDLISGKPYSFDSTYTPDWNETGPEFNANREHINGPPLNSILPAGSDLTILFKVKSTSSPTYNYAFAVGDTYNTFAWYWGSLYINVRVNSSFNIDYFLGDRWSPTVGALTMSGNDGSVITKVYNNGELITSDSSGNALPDSSNILNIGGRADDDDRYIGGVFEYFYVKKRALSDAEILSLSTNIWQWTYDKSEMLIRSVWAVAGGSSTYNMSMSESSSITDSLSNIATLIGSMTESDSITDSLTSLAIFIRNITESVAISDIFNGLADFIGSIGESATINDAPSSLIDFIGTINEISNTSDNLSNIANLFVSIAESNNIQDTLAAIGTFTHTINESATIEDAFRAIAAIIEFVKTFGEVSLTSKTRGSVSRTSDISGDVEKDNTIRGEVKNAD